MGATQRLCGQRSIPRTVLPGPSHFLHTSVFLSLLWRCCLFSLLSAFSCKCANSHKWYWWIRWGSSLLHSENINGSTRSQHEAELLPCFCWEVWEEVGLVASKLRSCGTSHWTIRPKHLFGYGSFPIPSTVTFAALLRKRCQCWNTTKYPCCCVSFMAVWTHVLNCLFRKLKD